MAVSTLARQSEDKYARQAYQRRKDDIYFYNKEKYEYEQKLAVAESAWEEEKRKRAVAESALQDKDKQIAELKALLGKE
jgi:hypothetical protein